VNSFCARMFGLTLFVFLVLALAVQPAIAQQDQAKHVVHRGFQPGIPVPLPQAIYDQWKASRMAPTVSNARVPWRDNITGLRGHAGVKHMRHLSHRSGGTTEV